jgi:hypothetical protein
MGCPEERRSAVGLRRVHIHTLLQQGPHGFAVVVPDRINEPKIDAESGKAGDERSK